MDNATALIAFDLGGVLVDVDKRRASAHLGIPHSLAEEAFFRNTNFESFTHGEIPTTMFFNQASLRLGGLDPTALENGFKQIMQPKSFCMDLIPRLQTPFTLWSNINLCHYKHICQCAPVLKNRVGSSGLSFEMGVSKPALRFFEECLANLKVAPSSILFLDDRLEHVQAARQLGIQARFVRNETEIYETLKSANVL